MIAGLILTISIYNSHLPAHLCVHLYTYLSLWLAKGRSTQWLCFLLNCHTLKLGGMEIHRQNENLGKNLQFLAHTESGVPACFARFLCQLHREEVLCVRKVLYWIKCTAQDNHNSTPVLSEVKLPAVLEDTLPHYYLFLYLSLCPVAGQHESNRFDYLFLPHFCLNSGMS